MMRRFFLFLSTQKGMRRWMETSPRAKKLTRRFVAGETLEEALEVSAGLAGESMTTTLDHLGENVTSIEEAAASRDAYITAIDEIAARKLPATVSIKLTQFGLDVDADACLENVRQLVGRAKSTGSRVEIDMESTAYTDRTLDLTRKMHDEFGCVRAVIQAYLRRSSDDIEQLNKAGIPVRLCKGAYDEPPTVAFPDKREVDRNYLVLMKTLLDKGNYPGIATHDERMIGEALRYIHERHLKPEQFEFQMLYGIRRDLQRLLTGRNHRLRLYVPYGTAWYPYFMRRLAERPANVVFLARNLFRS